MKIYFSQSYDSLVKSQSELFNEVIVGPLGLLRLFEREIGIISHESSELDRRYEYREVLEKYIAQKPQAFFEASFAIDPSGVSSELLKMRDALAFAGIFENSDSFSKRIEAIIDIEKMKAVQGIPDRWRNVLSQLKKSHIPIQFKSIVISEPQPFLQPFYARLFDCIDSDYPEVALFYGSDDVVEGDNDLTKVQELIIGNTEEKVALTGDGSFEIWEFSTPQEAVKVLTSDLAYKSNEFTLINQQEVALDNLLESYGAYQTGTAIRASHPADIQLFKLIPVLFSSMPDVEKLMSYLQVKLHPAPSELRYQLIKLLNDKGGFGDDKWNKIIEDFEYKHERQAALAKQFLQFKVAEAKGHSKQEIIDIYEALSAWAVARIHTIGDTDSLGVQYLLHLQHMGNGCVAYLNKYTADYLLNTDIDHLIQELYEGLTVKQTVLQRKAPFTVQEPANIHNYTDELIWFDFYNVDLKPSMNSFFRKAELLELSNKGFQFFNETNEVNWKIWKQQRPFFSAKRKLILITSQLSGASSTIEHPLMTLLKTKLEGKLDKVVKHPHHKLSSTIKTVRSMPAHELMISDLNSLCAINLREEESASSIEQLINYPFDWLMNYGFGIKSYQSFGLHDVTTAMGNVAHLYVEELLTAAFMDVDDALTHHNNNFDSQFLKCLIARGLVLQQKKNTSELLAFKTTLFQHVKDLLEFMQLNHLEPIESEMKLEETLKLVGDDAQKMVGYIDLLLKDALGNHIILDLKWTRSEKKYNQKVEHGADSQLVLYKYLLAKQLKLSPEKIKTVYGILSLNQLITRHKFKGDNVKRFENVTDEVVYQRVKNSIAFRLEQFEKGEVELGEESKVQDLPYYEALEDRDLMPLNTNSSNQKKKNYFSYTQLFKGQIK